MQTGVCEGIVLKIDSLSIVLEKEDSVNSVDIFISNLETDAETYADPSLSDGSLTHPFIDIMNGISKGRELVAPFTEGEIQIHLLKGTHYALWDYEHYLPNAKDLHSNNIKITIQYW